MPGCRIIQNTQELGQAGFQFICPAPNLHVAPPPKNCSTPSNPTSCAGYAGNTLLTDSHEIKCLSRADSHEIMYPV